MVDDERLEEAVVTEQGMFGELGLEDPNVRDAREKILKNKKREIEEACKKSRYSFNHTADELN